MIFRNRTEAGRKLAQALKKLESLHDRRDVLVLAIPRGGVVLGAEVARELGVPLDVWLARKIGAPGNPEFAIGSLSVNGELVLDAATIHTLGITRTYIEAETQRQAGELARRMLLFRGHAEPVKVRGKTVVLVDDGIATGSTALSALAALKHAGAAKRILAAPVAPLEGLPRMQAAADETVILHASSAFAAVGQFYEEFAQVPDEEVVRLLAAARNA